MKSFLWKIEKEKLNKTNLAIYSNFVKKHYTPLTCHLFKPIYGIFDARSSNGFGTHQSRLGLNPYNVSDVFKLVGIF